MARASRVRRVSSRRPPAEVLGASLAKGGPDGPYAHWDVGSEGVLSMLDRGFMTRTPSA
jgi:hypothetical protein